MPHVDTTGFTISQSAYVMFYQNRIDQLALNADVPNGLLDQNGRMNVVMTGTLNSYSRLTGYLVLPYSLLGSPTPFDSVEVLPLQRLVNDASWGRVYEVYEAYEACESESAGVACGQSHENYFLCRLCGDESLTTPADADGPTVTTTTRVDDDSFCESRISIV